MDQRDYLANKITAMVASIGKVDGEVPPDKDIYADLGVESINSIEILLALEDHFGITIDDIEFIKARTVSLLTELVYRTQAA